jgi:hypothetical protein
MRLLRAIGHTNSNRIGGADPCSATGAAPTRSRADRANRAAGSRFGCGDLLTARSTLEQFLVELRRCFECIRVLLGSAPGFAGGSCASEFQQHCCE